jgi:hypothetical protein
MCTSHATYNFSLSAKRKSQKCDANPVEIIMGALYNTEDILENV